MSFADVDAAGKLHACSTLYGTTIRIRISFPTHATCLGAGDDQNDAVRTGYVSCISTSCRGPTREIIHNCTASQHATSSSNF